METRRDPTLVVDRSVAEHLEVLSGVRLGGVGRQHRPDHRYAVHVHLLDAVDSTRGVDSGGFEKSREDVDHVMELLAQSAGIVHSTGPLHRDTVSGAAEVRCHLFHPLERRVEGPGPGQIEVVLATGRTEVVHVLEQPLGIFGQSVLERRRTPCAVQRAFGRCAVVAGDVHEERVVGFAHLVEGVEQAPDLLVGVGHESGEHFHEPRRDRLVAIGVLVPRRNLGRASRERGVGWDDPEFELTTEDPLAQGIPTVVELTLEAFDVFGPHVVWAMHGTSRHVGEERSLRIGGSLQLHPVDGTLDDVLGEVVIVAPLVGHDRCRLVEDRRLELGRLGRQNAVEPLEAETGGPAIERASERLLVLWCDVPLTESAGGVAVLLQHFGNRCCLARNDAVVAGKRGRTLGDAAHVHRMVVAAGQQGGACG